MFSPVVLKTAGLTVMNFVLSLAGRFLKNQKTDSLTRFTKATRVEPIALVDQRLAHQAYMPDVMQSLSSIFIGYYLQAVALSVNVGRINVIKLLDALNPSRDVHDAAATKIVDHINRPSMLSVESYKFGLPEPGESFGLEAFGDAERLVLNASAKVDGATDKINAGNADKPLGYDKGGLGKDTVKSAFEAVNLSVGKLVEVNVEQDGKSATFPVMIRLISTIMSANILVHILGDGSRNATFKERWHGWRSGALDFWRDIVLATDLIDEHRRALMKDKSGVYAEILERRRNNAAASMLNGTPSIGTASNIVVMSHESARELEAIVGGRLSNAKTREKIFENTYVMLLAVVNTEWEQITFYHRGIALPTELSIKELKTSNKGSGPDVGEILKAYQLGHNPTL